MTKIVTKSENTVKAYDYLKQNEGQAFTIKDVAEALGVTPAKVTGGLVSLEKKGILAKSEVEMEDGRTLKAYQIVDKEVEFAFEEPKNMSDKAVTLLQFMQKHASEDMTAAEIAEQLDMAPIAINGVLNGLVKRNLAFREEVEVEVDDKVKVLKFAKLTDEGKAYKF